MSTSPEEPEVAAPDATPPPRTPAEIFQASFDRYIKHIWRRNVQCPICGSHSWVQGTKAADLVIRDEPRAYTVGHIACTVCHHMLLFNVVSAGLYQDSKPIDWYPPAPVQATPDPAIAPEDEGGDSE